MVTEAIKESRLQKKYAGYRLAQKFARQVATSSGKGECYETIQAVFDL
jgi:hypothetical protein